MNNYDDYSYDTGLLDESGDPIIKLQPTVYLLDSFAMLMPEKFATEDEMSGQMSTTATAKANAKIFRTIIPLLKAANIILFVINHINQKIDINPMAKTKAQINYLKQDEIKELDHNYHQCMGKVIIAKINELATKEDDNS